MNLEYELAYIHTGLGINRFREEHSQQDWVWILEWWKVRTQKIEAATKKKK